MNTISRDGAWISQCSRDAFPGEDVSAVRSTKARKPRRMPANAVTAGDDSRDFIGRGGYKIVLALIRSIDAGELQSPLIPRAFEQLHLWQFCQVTLAEGMKW